MLLHVCCASCALPIIKHFFSDLPPHQKFWCGGLKEEDIALYFFNPNLFKEDEYQKRLKEVEKIASIYKLKLYSEKYNHNQWLNFIKENLPRPPDEYQENDERCLVCFKFRLNQTALFAKTHGFYEFATTLSVSRYKDVKFINQYAKSLAKKYGLKYKTFSLDQQKAHQTGINLSKKYNLYRQKYCGCEFSLPAPSA